MTNCCNSRHDTTCWQSAHRNLFVKTRRCRFISKFMPSIRSRTNGKIKPAGGIHAQFYIQTQCVNSQMLTTQCMGMGIQLKPSGQNKQMVSRVPYWNWFRHVVNGSVPAGSRRFSSGRVLRLCKSRWNMFLCGYSTNIPPGAWQGNIRTVIDGQRWPDNHEPTWTYLKPTFIPGQWKSNRISNVIRIEAEQWINHPFAMDIWNSLLPATGLLNNTRCCGFGAWI